MSRNIFEDTAFASAGEEGHTFPATVGTTDVLLVDHTTLMGEDATHISKKIMIHSLTYRSTVDWNFGEGTGFVTDLDDIRVSFIEGIYADDISTSGVPESAGGPFLFLDATNSTVDLRAFPDRIIHRRLSSLPTTTLFSADGSDAPTLGRINLLNHEDPNWGLEQRIRRKVRLEPDQGLFARLEVDSGQSSPVRYNWAFHGVISYEIVT